MATDGLFQLKSGLTSAPHWPQALQTLGRAAAALWLAATEASAPA
jgi:hypothetical protein